LLYEEPLFSRNLIPAKKTTILLTEFYRVILNVYATSLLRSEKCVAAFHMYP